MQAKNKDQEKNTKTPHKGVGRYLRFAIFLTNLIVIILLLAAPQAWTIKPTDAIVFSYLGLAFFFLLLANIAYLFLWFILRKWRYFSIELLVLIVCWTPIHTYIGLNSKSDNVPEGSIRILSYNVRHFNWLAGDLARSNPIFDYILEQNADIICLQEFGVSSKKTKNGLISKEEVDKIFADYPYNSFTRLGNHKSETLYGLMVYSKYPITSSQKVNIWSTYNGCGLHEIDIEGRNVLLANVHLESNHITSDDKKLYKDFLKSDKEISLSEVSSNIRSRLGVAYRVRERQTTIIREDIEKKNFDELLICGDFNDTPISYAYSNLKRNLTDSFVESGQGLGITFNENLFLFRIDYILHSDSFKAYNFMVGDMKYSDHYPIRTDLVFN